MEPEQLTQGFDYAMLATGAGIITLLGVYIGAGVKLKGWIIKGLTTLQAVKDYLNDPKEGILTLLKIEHEKELHELKEEMEKDYLDRDKKTTKWLSELQAETTKNGKLLAKIAGKVGVD